MDKNQQGDIRVKTVSNMVWRFAERCGAQGVTFVVSLVLARLLDPSDYGIIALVTVFTSILNVFVSSGLGSALVQKKDSDDLDFSTVFYYNLTFCIILYIGLFACAPLIAKFYNNMDLVPVVRVLGITVLIAGVKAIQTAYVSKHLIFKRFFFATLTGTIGAAIIGITMALLGFGVWALVAQHLFNSAIDTIMLWLTVKWRPKRAFSFARFKVLFAYGWRLLVASLIATVYNDIRQLIIGKIYTSSDLAYYNRGKSLPNFIVTNINSSIDSVLFPVMAKRQDNPEQVKKATRLAIRTSGYIMWPMMFGLAVCAKPFVTLVLTEKWLPSLPFIYIFCFSSGMLPIQTANINAIKAMGRSDLYMRMEIIKKSIALFLILCVCRISVLAIGLVGILITISASIVNSFPNKKLLGYSYGEQLLDMAPSFFLGGFMAAVVYCITFLNLPDILTLLLQVPLGVVIYIGGSILFKLESYTYVLNLVKVFLKSRGLLHEKI